MVQNFYEDAMNDLRELPRKVPRAGAALLLLLPTTVLLLLVVLPFYPRAPDQLPWPTTSRAPVTSSPPSSPPPPPPPPPHTVVDLAVPEDCDLFRGDWVPDPEAPYYTNESCPFMDERQNCMKNGRPDGGFLRWRWRPERCDLPAFDAAAFLELVRGKSMAFVGDSLARNHMESLLCLLNRVGKPVKLYSSRFFFPEHNFNLTIIWSQFLVKADSTGPDKVTHGSYHLHLDEPDAAWTSRIGSFDYVIISASRWFFRPNYFYEHNKLIGCNWCSNSTVREMSFLYAYQRVFRTTFAYLNNLPSYHGVTLLLTYSTSHYENGDWGTGGDCPRTKPRKSKEVMPLEGFDVKMYNAPVEEFRVAKEVGAKRGLEYHLLDITRALLLRPDGHPNIYGHPMTDRSVNMSKDCVHWCLPGPIDSWSNFLLEILRRVRFSRKEKRLDERKKEP